MARLRAVVTIHPHAGSTHRRGYETRRVPIADPRAARRLLETTAFLQEIARSKDLLSGLSREERTDLLNAAGDVFCADPEERRLRMKAQRNRRRAERLGVWQRLDDETIARLESSRWWEHDLSELIERPPVSGLLG